MAKTELKNIIKLTEAQFNTLAAGGTAGGYTGLSTNNIYFVYKTPQILTTAPTEAYTGDDIKIVVLSSEPTTKYAGYFYFITQ